MHGFSEFFKALVGFIGREAAKVLQHLTLLALPFVQDLAQYKFGKDPAAKQAALDDLKRLALTAEAQAVDFVKSDLVGPNGALNTDFLDALPGGAIKRYLAKLRIVDVLRESGQAIPPDDQLNQAVELALARVKATAASPAPAS